VTDDRAYPSRPFVGVRAVVIDQELVLLVKRGRPPLAGHWSLPGGAVETGETLVAAVQREVYEETGLVVDVGPRLAVLDRIHLDANGRAEYHYVLIDFACQVVGGALQPHSDAADARWVSRPELPGLSLSGEMLGVIDEAFMCLGDRA